VRKPVIHGEDNPKSKIECRLRQEDFKKEIRIENPKSPGRREWLLRLGETAFLIGFSGSLGEAKPEVLPAAVSSHTGTAMPPGLYEPSNDHLSHALSSDASLHPIPADSPTDYVRPLSDPFQPEFLAAKEFQVVRRIVELIIGEEAALSGVAVVGSADATSHAGSPVRSDHVADEVAQWIDLRLAQVQAIRGAAERLAPDHRALAAAYHGSDRVEKLERDDSQNTCRDGLRWLEEQSQQRHHMSFLSIDQGQQLELLKLISDDRSDTSQQNAGTRFFVWIKEETIRGYYTSQAGLKEIDYRGNAFYAEPPGCEAPSPLDNKNS
jgi:Gluconate 2-dehydrogenase subunit 3